MNRLVLYCDPSMDPLPEVTVAEYDLVTVHYTRDLVDAIVDEPRLVGVVMLMRVADESWQRLIVSVKKSFPLMPMLVGTRAPFAKPPGTIETFTFTDVNDKTSERVTTFAREHAATERREHHRFDFPLRAKLDSADTPIHHIGQISAGGAFLIPNKTDLTPGTICEIELLFQNFSITTNCEILNPRHVDSRAGDGFGIRFTSLSPAATSFIDRIVHDALIETMMNPDARPPVPSLDEDEDLLSIGDEFSLSI
ncbi:MAG: PilZ domain-containing protein [Spirochaetales bacterium]